MNALVEYLGISLPPERLWRIASSLILIVVLSALRLLAVRLMAKRTLEASRSYHRRRMIDYTFFALIILLVGRIWIRGLGSLSTFLGLASAGLAIALHDTVANIAGWIFIVSRKPFKLGDRVQIGDTAGDVIDIRLFQFSLIEIGNWVHAEQSTGRIIHVPNSRVLRENLANYETGFEYIWHEIPVLITFESNWRKAKELLSGIAAEKTEHLSKGAEEQIRLAAMRYLIFFRKLTPIVYTSVQDSGVRLTLRYIVKPRERRSSEQTVWEAILEAFARHDDIDFAYPTTRFYRAGETAPQTPPGPDA
jgi:small-conductance mechanosensitive channel